MIVKWPGKIKSNSLTDHISAFWDVFPTLSEITGVEVPDYVDGVSFLPTLLGNTENQETHDYLYWEFHEMGGKQALRIGNWKAVKNEVFKDSDVSIELYDLQLDISEENNVAKDNPLIVEKMEELFEEAQTPSELFSFN